MTETDGSAALQAMMLVAGLCALVGLGAGWIVARRRRISFIGFFRRRGLLRTGFELLTATFLAVSGSTRFTAPLSVGQYFVLFLAGTGLAALAILAFFRSVRTAYPEDWRQLEHGLPTSSDLRGYVIRGAFITCGGLLLGVGGLWLVFKGVLGWPL